MLEILDETSRYPRRKRRELASALDRLLAHFGADDREATIVIVGDSRMHALNLEHRGIDNATDVLSYPLHEPTDAGYPQVPHLGDVIVNLDQALRQRPDDVDAEIKVLAAHGMMHLLGYDHETEDAWIIFNRAQKLVLEPPP